MFRVVDRKENWDRCSSQERPLVSKEVPETKIREKVRAGIDRQEAAKIFDKGEKEKKDGRRFFYSFMRLSLGVREGH